MPASSDDILQFLEAVSCFFTFLTLAVVGLALLFYTVVGTMSKLAKDEDDVEQLALKFSHRR